LSSPILSPILVDLSSDLSFRGISEALFVEIRIWWVVLTVIDGRPLFGNTGRIKRAYGIWKGPVGVS
jgi:hypothetical protein